MNEAYDVAIIGGGPAGSTAATVLVRAGRRVIVLERDKFPRFHIGESLLPFSMQTFTRLGLHEKFLRAGFIEKFGGEMCGACSDEGVKFYFQDGFRSKTDRSYQVRRAEFDKLLLDHARENGAEVHEETAVHDIELTDELDWLNQSSSSDAASPGVVLHTSGGEVRARYLIDASGRNSLLANKFKLKHTYEHLKKISIFAHYENVDREAGRDGTLTRMVRGIDRWFWMIPLTPTRMSIGVVLDSAVYKNARLSPEEFLEQALAEQPLIVSRLRASERVSPVHVAADFSYRNNPMTGERWMLAGDAAGFIDPVFSSGVFLAILAGEQCADVLNVVLDDPAKKSRLFRRYERLMNRAMDVYLRFVNAWYTKEFMEVFLSPAPLLQIPEAVNAVLAGNVGTSFAIGWRMEIFYLLVRLQKWIAICPRRTFIPNGKQMAAEFAEPAEVLT
jgi:flavin-dependent dehydrogenase